MHVLCPATGVRKATGPALFPCKQAPKPLHVLPLQSKSGSHHNMCKLSSRCSALLTGVWHPQLESGQGTREPSAAQISSPKFVPRRLLTTSFSKYGFKKGPQAKLLIVQLPLSIDLDLDRDLCRSSDDGDLDLLEEPRFWLFSGIGDLLTDRDLLWLLLLDLL